MTAALYIHIPFCRSRCAYCDFFSTTREPEMPAYVQALCHEVEARRSELPHARVRTIYIGGGTPSLLSPTLLRRILDTVYANYEVDANAEVTMEMNPDDLDPPPAPPVREGGSCALISSLQAGGLPSLTGGVGGGSINRVSLGIQTFDDDLLRLIHRRHDSATAVRAVKQLQATGIRNISIDLIYGLPGQTLAQWEHDLDTAFALGVQHLSAYALSYEEGTLLTRWRDEGSIREASDELSVEMFQRLCQRAREAGFEHYEISNFALPGYQSRHNSSYWTGIPYLGFGPGAHSYDGQHTRRANLPNLNEYLSFYSSPRGGHEGAAPCSYEQLSDPDLHDEAVMCGLRTREGIDLQQFLARFGQSRLDALLTNAAPHLSAGRLIRAADHLHLAEHALMVSDDIMSDLMA